MRGRTMLLSGVLFVATVLSAGPGVRAQPAGGGMQLEGVQLLFDLIATIVGENPGYTDTLAALSGLDDAAAGREFDRLAQRNRDNPRISNAIDNLFATDTYRFYFSRFRNVTPDIFRTAFVNLPYRAVKSPGGIASCFLELCGNVDAVRAWKDDVVLRIDLNRCAANAKRWLPAGDYPPVTIYFIYDSNAGSFTAGGRPFFNLLSMIGEFSGTGDLASRLREIDVDAMEAVIAHEMNHVYARPVLYPPGREFDEWQDGWLDTIVRGIVSEGVAGQCNPCTGFKKELWEDPAVIARLIGSLNETGIAMYAGTMDDEAVTAWYRATFNQSARLLLEEYLRKRYDEPEAKRMFRAYISFRPDLLHTLGWWMVSRITRDQALPERGVNLLVDPCSLFDRYNDTLGDGADSLRVDPLLAERARVLLTGSN